MELGDNVLTLNGDDNISCHSVSVGQSPVPSPASTDAHVLCVVFVYTLGALSL